MANTNRIARLKELLSAAAAEPIFAAVATELLQLLPEDIPSDLGSTLAELQRRVRSIGTGNPYSLTPATLIAEIRAFINQVEARKA